MFNFYSSIKISKEANKVAPSICSHTSFLHFVEECDNSVAIRPDQDLRFVDDEGFEFLETIDACIDFRINY